MRHVARVSLVVALWLSSSVVAASAQSATGLEPDRKAAAATPWSADATVARLVYGPVKILGMGRFTAEGRVELKGPMRRAESGVREIMARLSSGEIGEPEARVELAAVIADYRISVRKLWTAR